MMHRFMLTDVDHTYRQQKQRRLEICRRTPKRLTYLDHHTIFAIICHIWLQRQRILRYGISQSAQFITGSFSESDDKTTVGL